MLSNIEKRNELMMYLRRFQDKGMTAESYLALTPVAVDACVFMDGKKNKYFTAQEYADDDPGTTDVIGIFDDTFFDALSSSIEHANHFQIEMFHSWMKSVLNRKDAGMEG